MVDQEVASECFDLASVDLHPYLLGLPAPPVGFAPSVCSKSRAQVAASATASGVVNAASTVDTTRLAATGPSSVANCRAIR